MKFGVDRPTRWAWDELLSQARELVEAAESAGVVNMMSLSTRFANDVIYLGDAVAQGELGDIYYARVTPGGVVLDPNGQVLAAGEYRQFLADAGTRDAFGHAQLGGAAPVVASIVREKLGYKYHWAVSDYLQRSARHIASATDVKQAYAVGEAAVKMALAGKTAVMPVIKRVSDKPYRWKIESAPLSRIANKEKMLPRRYITQDGFGITPAARRYLEPLIRGEDYPPYINGLPKYVTLKNAPVKPRLKTKFVV